jgi:MFS transporter, DHA1 family, multidrug resistance protein
MVVTWLVLPRARHVVLRKPIRRPFGIEARELARNWPLLACWFATFGGCVGLGMFVTYVPLHGRDQGLSVAQVGLLFTVQGLLNALARIPFGRLSDRVADRSHPVVAGLACFAFAIAGFGIASNLLSFMIPAGLVGVSMAVAFTAIGALISEVVKPESRGLAMGGYNTSIYFGMMLGSMMMGPVIREIGFKHGFFLVGCLNLITTALFFVVFYHARHRPKTENTSPVPKSPEPEASNPRPET